MEDKILINELLIKKFPNTIYTPNKNIIINSIYNYIISKYNIHKQEKEGRTWLLTLPNYKYPRNDYKTDVFVHLFDLIVGNLDFDGFNNNVISIDRLEKTYINNKYVQRLIDDKILTICNADFDITKNLLKKWGSKKFSEVLKTNLNLHILILEELDENISNALKINKSVVELQIFGGYNIKTYINLESMLKENKHILNLNLSEGNVYDKNIDFLINGLKFNNTIKILSLSNNIQYDSRVPIFQKEKEILIEKIIELLKTNNSIISLEINFNGIYGYSFKPLFEYLKYNTNIIYLILKNNRFNHNTTFDIIDMLKENHTIENIIGYNNFDHLQHQGDEYDYKNTIVNLLDRNVKNSINKYNLKLLRNYLDKSGVYIPYAVKEEFLEFANNIKYT